MDRSGSGKGWMAGTNEYTDETSGSIKHREILDQLLEKDSATWS